VRDQTVRQRRANASPPPRRHNNDNAQTPSSSSLHNNNVRLRCASESPRPSAAAASDTAKDGGGRGDVVSTRSTSRSRSPRLRWLFRRRQVRAQRRRDKPSSALKKEIKAARQLGVIMGAFTVCFLSS